MPPFPKSLKPLVGENFYSVAILELDSTALPGRIAEAQGAIDDSRAIVN
jgi:hypothetical protein